MKEISHKGFTLIELLMVIAIIGLLGAIVLGSLQSSRNRAVDAAIKENLVNIRPTAELLFSNDGRYIDLFINGGPARTMFLAALSAQGNNSGEWSRGETANPQYSTWSAWVGLKTDPSAAWCVDYNGASRKIALPDGLSEVISCPAAIP